MNNEVLQQNGNNNQSKSETAPFYSRFIFRRMMAPVSMTAGSGSASHVITLLERHLPKLWEHFRVQHNNET